MKRTLSLATLAFLLATTANSQQITNQTSSSGGGAPSGPAGGDLSGSYPNPGVAKVNGNTPGGTCATHTFSSSVSSSAVPTCTQPAAGDVTGLAASATTDTTNASNISTGTLGAGRLPSPTASTLGGIESFASVTHEWINTISTAGVPSATQPACGDLSNSAASCSTDATNATNISSGTLNAARLPAAPFATGSSTGNTLTAPIGYFVCTATCTVTPPVPAAGYQFCVMNDDNTTGTITLGALGSSARYENTARTAYGTAGTGTLASGGAAGDMVCIVGRDSTHYLTPTFVGTWTAS